MTLLVEVMEKPLDPGYAEAAQRRAAGGAPGRGAGTVLLILVAVLLGLMTTAAAMQLRAPSGAVEARELLEQEIVDRQAQVEASRAASAELSREIAALQQQVLAARDQGLLDDLRLDGVVTGAEAVSGPGLVVTVSDGDRLDENGSASSSRVQAVDLQTVVNALWASGAEAISVGGERLTSLSAIRHAGEAIMVDLVPLPGPDYVVEAVGDPEELQAAYARTGAPAYTQLLSSQWGIRTGVDVADELSLSSGGQQSLRFAEPVSDDAGDSEEESP
ncbi:uncharacterized protein YlxW (UPF0749 family) [Isoptericola jiangsuensis]|uniref:Uncharacterized protein YlxW (UPF0749 family) n=1 Tax=Isoptericola jiangsuensis TaxID=548579 RepID=A0A2A9EY44_9MICO|nr:DUF881 domain-containing protein [Isoptericola jiangsuensis]PFG43232.1 uncharacterized protein YlxW (UPF0749 family) [Isoptericola jiangsuensis]